jgi:hypothetical protein
MVMLSISSLKRKKKESVFLLLLPSFFWQDYYCMTVGEGSAVPVVAVVVLLIWDSPCTIGGAAAAPI